jgi:hypothetical protein
MLRRILGRPEKEDNNAEFSVFVVIHNTTIIKLNPITGVRCYVFSLMVLCCATQQ